MELLEYLQNIIKKVEAKVTNFTDEWWNEIFPKSLEKVVDTDFDELLEEEAPAAGAEGGLGHNFVRNDRISEEVNPPGFEFPGTARDVGEIKTGKAIKDSITEEYLKDLYEDPISSENEDDKPDDDEENNNPPPPPPSDDEEDDDDEDEVNEDDDNENPPDNDEDENDDPDNEDDDDDDEDDEDDNDPPDEDDDDDDDDDDDEEDDDDDDDEDPDDDDDPPDDNDELTGQNPGNDKEVGNSQWDGETGASGKEGKGKHQDGIDTDENQPGGKEKGQNLTEDDLIYDNSSSNSTQDYFIDLDVKNPFPPSYDNSYDL